MSVLRIRAPLGRAPSSCAWTLISDGREAADGEGPLSALPRHAARVQLVVPANDVLITRARLPAGARPRGAALAYAIEDRMAADPDASDVLWLGEAAAAERSTSKAVGGTSDAAGAANAIVAALDRQGLAHWREALARADFGGYELHSEILLLPWTPGTWTLAWDGREGVLRTGALEGAATDQGDRSNAPLALRLALAKVDERPSRIMVYTAPSVHPGAGAAPNLAAWEAQLGLPLQLAGPWDWRMAPADAGPALVSERRRWLGFAGTLPRLRAAAWLAGAALVLHALFAGLNWAVLAAEQRNLRQGMETRFRAEFPDAVAVVDPALQMRRKLAEARHAAGQPDGGDFLPMIDKVAQAVAGLPPGSVRTLSFENGRMSLELPGVDEAGLQRLRAALRDRGLGVDASPRRAGAAAAPVISVRAL